MSADFVVNALVLLAGAAVIWALCRAATPTPVFRIRIDDGQVQATKGVVTLACLERVREVCAAHAIVRGEIAGYPHGALMRLAFSPEIPDAARQQLRNWWASFGWAAPRRAEAGRRC